jgi:hypothetical protein
MRTRIAGLAAVSCALLLALPMQTGAASNIKTKVEITEGGPTLFEGTVSSKEPKCEKGRTVELLYTAGKQETVVGTDKTDKKGNWSMPGDYFAGTYTAEVKEKSVNTKRKKCKGARTPGERY